MIRMINGFTGIGRKIVGPKDGPFELPPENEKRLVALGVAEYVESAVANNGAAAGDTDTAVPGANTGPAENAAEGAQAAPAAVAPDDCIDFDEDGHMTVESLMKMTRANLEALAEDLGLEVRKCRNKGEIAALIAQVKHDLAAQGDEGPELSAALPS